MEAARLRCPSCGAAAAADAVQCAYCQTQLATVACPCCFGRVFLGSRYCAHCGAEIQVLKESPSSHGCPECRIALASSRVGSADLEQCHRCGGVWLPLTLFERLAEDRERRGECLAALPGAPETAPGSEGAVHYRPCPQCGTLMNRSNYSRISGVILDTCKAHGIWFDRDELRRVLAFIEQGGLERSRERQIRELDDKQRLAALAAPVRTDWEGRPDVQGPGLADLLGALSGVVARLRN